MPGLRRDENNSPLPCPASSPVSPALLRVPQHWTSSTSASQEKPVTSFLLSVVLGSHTILPPKCIFLLEMCLVSATVTTLLVVFQSKEIGLQMHEELLKVTNELYTVSDELVLPRGVSHNCPLGVSGDVLGMVWWDPWCAQCSQLRVALRPVPVSPVSLPGAGGSRAVLLGACWPLGGGWM